MSIIPTFRRLIRRLNLSHKWRTFRTDDGTGRYQRCLKCNKERDMPNPLATGGPTMPYF